MPFLLRLKRTPQATSITCPALENACPIWIREQLERDVALAKERIIIWEYTRSQHLLDMQRRRKARKAALRRATRHGKGTTPKPTRTLRSMVKVSK